MNQNIEIKNLRGGNSTTIRRPLLDVVEISTAGGQWIVPAMQEVSLAMALSDFSATWQVSRGVRSESFSVGTVAICELDPYTNIRNARDRKLRRCALAQ